MTDPRSRRDFFRVSAATTGALLLPYGYPVGRTLADEPRGPNDRPRIGAIGVGGRGSGIARSAAKYGDIIAVCDVDRAHAERAAAEENLGKGKAEIHEDYRKLLDRQDVDVVTIGTPDHWHTAICIAALRAGKDVYCEKPLTLTIDEGKILRRVVHETGRVFQVGTQQRSEFRNMFLTAVALVRDGRIGRVKRVTCAIGGAPSAKESFAKSDPPLGLNWDMWLGQAAKVDYIKERCHGTFRWWYEYSGGKLTDWGAHHVDIAQWAIGMENSGPKTVEVLSVEHPVPFQNGYPTVDDRYNTATAFQVRCVFPNEVEVLIRHDTSNGITFEGERGEFFVSRGKIAGEPIDALKDHPLDEALLVALRRGKRLDSHMANFFECVADRSTPVSDVDTHHRAMTTCHLANIALRLGRTLTWDPIAEEIVGDSEANAWQRREPRKGYELGA
jgi:predicted dehydrogenase